jgi:hypothetical protein
MAGTFLEIKIRGVRCRSFPLKRQRAIYCLKNSLWLYMGVIFECCVKMYFFHPVLILCCHSAA